MSLILSIMILKDQSNFIIKEIEKRVPIFIFRPLILQTAKRKEDVLFLMNLFDIDPMGGDFPRGEVIT